MKETVTFIITVLLLFSFLACGQQEKQDTSKLEDQDESGLEEDLSFEVTLTQALIDKYIETLPPFIKKAKEMDKDIETIGAAWLAGEEMVSLLKAHGWSKPEEFGQVHGKVWAITPFLAMSAQMEGQSDEMQEMLLEQFEELFTESGVSEQEKQLLIANQDKLFAAMQEADQ